VKFLHPRILKLKIRETDKKSDIMAIVGIYDTFKYFSYNCPCWFSRFIINSILLATINLKNLKWVYLVNSTKIKKKHLFTFNMASFAIFDQWRMTFKEKIEKQEIYWRKSFTNEIDSRGQIKIYLFFRPQRKSQNFKNLFFKKSNKQFPE
jgi:hypothetical protein